MFRDYAKAKASENKRAEALEIERRASFATLASLVEAINHERAVIAQKEKANALLREQIILHQRFINTMGLEQQFRQFTNEHILNDDIASLVYSVSDISLDLDEEPPNTPIASVRTPSPSASS